MSSSRRRLGPAAPLALLLVLTACGFEPLYGGGDGTVVREDLTQVEILPIDDRSGQILRNELKNMMHPRGGAAERPYQLEVKVTQNKQDLLVSKSGFSTRANMVASTAYTLREVATGRVLLNDSAILTASYNVSSSDFATLSAERDARDRVLRDLARTVASRVAVYFRQVREGPRAP